MVKRLREASELGNPVEMRISRAVLIDLLQVAWALADERFEQLLGVEPGWLENLKHHKAQFTPAISDRLGRLTRFHNAVRHCSPRSFYNEFWDAAWPHDSPLGARSPWEAWMKEGEVSLRAIEAVAHRGELD